MLYEVGQIIASTIGGIFSLVVAYKEFFEGNHRNPAFEEGSKSGVVFRELGKRNRVYWGGQPRGIQGRIYTHN